MEMKLVSQCRILSISIFYFMFCVPSILQAEVNRAKFEAGGNYLIVEALDDDLVHFEYGRGSGPSTDQSIQVTDMVFKKDYLGSEQFSDNGSGIVETKDIKIEVNRDNLFVTLFDKNKNLLLTTIEPFNLGQACKEDCNNHYPCKGIRATRRSDTDFNVYGLGQQFVEPNSSAFDWEGKVRQGGNFGNIMEGFDGRVAGNTQVPILYAINGSTTQNYAVFLDNIYKQIWDFRSKSKWEARMFGEEIRFYVMTGHDLPNLRKDYMELVGHPLVPPKKMFGLWVSEYGYESWGEVDDILKGLRAEKFPVDGFVLDLQWFGGIPPLHPGMKPEETRMGSLDFDLTNFPDPEQKIKHYKEDEGIGIMLIEEAYVGLKPSEENEHDTLKREGCLVRRCVNCSEPLFMDGSDFWGKGGMIDYTSSRCGEFWHNLERQDLINMGVIGHWTDLGEPERYDCNAGYDAGSHDDAHNIFNFRWIRSIYDGYENNNVQYRPFIMARSGTAGMQRFGSAVWSADIASRLSSLATHFANQANMSFSGIDYYSSDTGGFGRQQFNGSYDDHDGNGRPDQLDELYTQWYANGLMFDVPPRPHTDKGNCPFPGCVDKNRDTAPNRIGHMKSNLANTRLRYSMIPYLYSLAHRAHRFGEPIMPPPLFYYQIDKKLQNVGHEKMIGRDLLAAVIAKHDETKRDVQLPAGTWIDWYTNRRHKSPSGLLITDVPGWTSSGIFRLPLYAREGAIIPMQYVDDKTMNSIGRRSDGTLRNELIVKVFAFENDGDSQFTLFEDDGATNAYLNGAVRETTISQQREGNQIAVNVHPSIGTYDGAPRSRNYLVELILEDQVLGVKLGNDNLIRRSSRGDFDKNNSGWFDSGSKTVLAKSGDRDVINSKNFHFDLGGIPIRCNSEFKSISIPGSSNGWNLEDETRILIRDNCRDKKWTGLVKMCKEEYKFAADRSWEQNWGSDGKQNGPNFHELETEGFYDVTFDENNPSNPVMNLVQEEDCSLSVKFICENGITENGISVYVIGDIPELGAWIPEQAKILQPNGPYPIWTGFIRNLPGNTLINWKCIKRIENHDMRVIEWEPGTNNSFTTPSSGKAGDQTGTF